jgi:plastocyanin
MVVNLTIFAGEINATTYGFGNSSSTLTSPGTDLILNVGQAYNMTLVNAGTHRHNWAIVDAKSSTANVLFNAQIANATNGVAIGTSQSVTFTPTQAGNFYYICQVDAHATLGMWGNVTVNP